ncbi:MAG: rhodanese-like domain-containing protein [Erythrobacter sp.]
MTQTRSALRLAAALPLLLALGACGGEQGGSGNDRGAAPVGFELAAAATADAPAKGAPSGEARIVEVTPEDLWAQIEAGKVRVIDVRTREEAIAGVIPEADHIPLDRFDPAKLDLSDGRKVVLYCRSGRRSAIAAEKLATFTGQPVEHLAGGMLSWEASGLPIDKPEKLAE